MEFVVNNDEDIVLASIHEVASLISEKINPPEVYGLKDFSFDDSILDDITTLKASISIFKELGLIEKFNIPYDILCGFLLTVKKNYRLVSYHNWRHAFNFMSTMYTFMTIKGIDGIFSDLEIFALLIASISHDLDHRGTTNNFQKKFGSSLAKSYSSSLLEHHHFNKCREILHDGNNNILINLTPIQNAIVFDLIEKAILATDLSIHFKNLDNLVEIAYSGTNEKFEIPEHKYLLMGALMTSCDLNNTFKPWNCYRKCCVKIVQEFYNQGDMEKEKFNKEPISSMDRQKAYMMPQLQIGFLTNICMPLFLALGNWNSLLKLLSVNCRHNINAWKTIEMIKSNGKRN